MTMDELKLRDAMRGIMWEEKFRGTLEEHRNPDILTFAARRWLVVPELPRRLYDPDWPANRIGWGTYRWKYNQELVEEALHLGVGVIDTAEGYGFGRVEKALGEVFGRVGVCTDTWVASKVARNHMTVAACISAARRSRDNLRVPTIDLYQVHWPVFPLDRVMDALADLLEEGTIRRVGVCNFCAGQLATAVRLATERGFRIMSNQVRLSREAPGTAEYLTGYCARVGVRVIAHSPLNQRRVCAEASEALRWVLTRPGVSSVVPGTNNVVHLRENTRLETR